VRGTLPFRTSEPVVKSPSDSFFVQVEGRNLSPNVVDAQNPLTDTRLSFGRYLLRPLSLCLISLATAVFLWGLTYKVSLYHLHPNRAARVSVAKLWVDPRESLITITIRAASTALCLSELQLPRTVSFQLPPSIQATLCTPIAARAISTLHTFVGTPRSPPPQCS
jgi:hypothetical protein